MADPDRKDPHRPSHPGNHPTSPRKGASNPGRKIGIVAGVVVLVALLWWLFAGPTQQPPGQEHTLGEPAGVGQAADPEAADAIEPAADPDDPQAAIGPDPFTEPTSPRAAEEAGAPPPADGADQDTAEDPVETPAPAN
jgi:uncharacterized iron-regulated membrane protein